MSASTPMVSLRFGPLFCKKRIGDVMRSKTVTWDGLDFAIVRYVEQSPGITIPDVMRGIDATIPINTIRNRVTRLAAHGVIQMDRVLGRYYVLTPGAGLEAV